jgi:hypothetical protein
MRTCAVLGLAAGATRERWWRRCRLPRRRRRCEATPREGEGGVVPVSGCVEGFSRVLDGIGLGQNPIPTLPNMVFGLAREIAPARARFRVSGGFGPFPPQNSLTQMRPKHMS